MKTQIYPQEWIHLPRETRLHLIKVFGLKRTGITEVRDQEVISDGFTADDLKGIHIEKMCEYIGSQETFIRAWEITLAKVHAELNPPIGEIKSVDGEPTIVEVVEKVEVVISAENEDSLKDLEVAQKIASEMENNLEVVKPFCDTCASKGVRHLKDCPKYVAIPPRGSASEFAKQLQ